MYCLVSDIDGTLLGSCEALDNLNANLKKIRESLFLVYATGRNLEEFNDALAVEPLLKPDAAILNTGADIYINENGVFKPAGGWHEKIGKCNYDAAGIKKVLDTIEGMEPHSCMPKYKVSYSAGRNAAALSVRAVEALKEAGFEFKAVFSHEKYLDIIPPLCDKGQAALYLTGIKGIKREEVVVAGDSENDLDMFLCFDHGIMVNNAMDGLKETLKGRAIYRAQEPYAAGLLEGLVYYEKKGILKGAGLA